MQNDIANLVKKFNDNKDFYCSDKYNESQLRVDFLDPLFELLGWDIRNASGKPTYEREVVVEESVKTEISDNAKKPDYTFRLYSDRKYFLEAKKPKVDISHDPNAAKQVRRYGYTAKLKISVLSNFEYLAIYDCTKNIDDGDEAYTSRIQLIHCDAYANGFDELKSLLGKESVYTGQFDREWSDSESHVTGLSVDDLFLEQLTQWRLLLGAQIFESNSKIDSLELNDLVQRYINSIVFLRVCEDRNLETYKSLLECAESNDFESLKQQFKTADRKYNAGLFDLPLTSNVITDNGSSFWQIIKHLYFPESPYSFSVFSSDILGNIYEIFLGEELVIDGSQIELCKKPELVDRDVVTTPTYIIREILRRTVSEYCNEKSDEQILNSIFADISCGSGAFLTQAYQLIHDTLVDFYIANDPDQLIPTAVDTFKLPYEIKRKIIENCIFAVDKDYNAVQACKFGLLLKLLEGEHPDTLTQPALPNLENIIVYGNSLVEPSSVQPEYINVINPYDFGDQNFDVIFGNPPYMATEHMKMFTPMELPIYKEKYEAAHKQFDKYFLFIERGYSLLSQNGILGYIVPNKLTKLGAGRKLRQFLKERGAVKELTSFGANQVFNDKTTYTCLLVLSKQSQSNFKYTEVQSLDQWIIREDISAQPTSISIADLNDDGWPLVSKELNSHYSEILDKSIALDELVGDGNISNGIQTSANKIYIHKATNEDNQYFHFELDGNSWKIEKELTRPYFKTSGGVDNLNTYRELSSNAFVIYPYIKTGGSIAFVDIDSMRINYPFLLQYLMNYKQDLGKRDIKPEPVSSDEWYRFGRHQALEKCDVDLKIVVGVLSQKNKYAIDTRGTLISSGGTAGYCMITLPDACEYSPYYVQAILNSKYCEWFASIYGEIFRGGYIARGTKVLKKLPIRKIDFSSNSEVALHDQIVDLQQQLISKQAEIDSAIGNQRRLIPLNRQFDALLYNINQVLSELYNLGQRDNELPLISELYAIN